MHIYPFCPTIRCATRDEREWIVVKTLGFFLYEFIYVFPLIILNLTEDFHSRSSLVAKRIVEQKGTQFLCII